MKRTTLATLTAALLAATPVLGQGQLAGSIGIAQDGYSAAELAQIKNAIETEDRRLAEYLRQAGVGDVISTQSVGVSAGDVQLSRDLGVVPGTLSTAELAQLKSALENDDRVLAAHIRAGGIGQDVISTQSPTAMEGRAQIAAHLGVDAGQTSLAEMAGGYLGKYD